MSTKNSVHSSETTRHQSSIHSRELLFVVGLVLVIALAVVIVNRQSGSSKALSTPQMFEAAPEVTYRDAQAIAVDPTANDEAALARAQFTQPWMNPDAVAADPASRYIETQAVEAAPAVDYRDALTTANTEMSGTAVDYDEALAVLQFTQPWLDPQAEPADLASRYIEAQTMTNAEFIEAAPIVDYREALEVANDHSVLDQQLGDSTLSYDEVLAIPAFTSQSHIRIAC
jgi:hypothetical protein